MKNRIAIKLTDVIILIISCIIGLDATTNIEAQTVKAWVTEANQNSLLTLQGPVSFNTAGGSPTIKVTPSTTYQTIDGFGICLTEGSAEQINSLNSTQQTNILSQLFNPSPGIAMSVLRISIGASDLSSSNYSYDDLGTGTDPSLTNFSLAGPDLTNLIPLLKKILLINPNIKILATPWSAPTWMKSNNAWIGGSLNTVNYSTYANYFVKYITAMKAQGINIWAITPQNEPENGGNEPSMTFTAQQEQDFINNNLGPALQSAGYGSIKIIAYDHNCDDTIFPEQVCNNSTYVDGAAFHLYAGNISAMSAVKSNTGKNVYFTEQYTGTGSNFWNNFNWHVPNVMIGATTNWGKIALEWNLATDGNSTPGPHTPGGCTTCRGAVTVNNSNSYTLNESYYIVGHFSEFVQPGALRIGSTSSDGSLPNVAFKNPDGSIVLVIYNTNSYGYDLTIGIGSKQSPFHLNSNAAVTLLWSAAILPIELISFTASVINDHNTLLTWSTAKETNSDYFVLEKSTNRFSSSSLDTIKAQGNSNSLVNYTYTDNSFLNGTAYYRLKQVDNNGSSSYSSIESISNSNNQISIIPNPSTGIFFINFHKNTTEIYHIKILNLLGQQVYNVSIEEGEFISKEIDLSLEEAGIYIIRVESNTTQLNSKIEKF